MSSWDFCGALYFRFGAKFSSVQSLGHVQLFETPWTAARQASMLTTKSQSLFKLMSIKLVMLSNHHTLLSPSPPTFNLSQHQGLFQWFGSPIRWPKYWNSNFTISSFNEYSGLIYLRIDWFNLHAVQGTLKSLFQHHSLQASILWCSAFFMVQPSHLYVATRKKNSFDYMDLCLQSDVSVF